jgi:hypothetical protein
MRQIRIMALMCIVCSIFAFNPPISTPNSSKPIPISIVDASNSGVIHVRAHGSGGHMGKCISMDLQNVKDYPIEVHLKAGHQLHSNDLEVQDILVGRSQRVILAGGEKKSIEVYGFCCEANNDPPTSDAFYEKIELASPKLVTLATYIDENKFPMSMSQNAVWVVSDSSNIASVRNDDSLSIRLQQFVADLTDQEIPDYTIAFSDDEEGSFSTRPARLMGTFDYTVPRYGVLSLIICDEDDKQVRSLFVKHNQRPQVGYEYDYNVDVSDLNEGKYYIRLFSANNVIKEEEIKL